MSAGERDPERPDPLRPSREIVRETLIERKIREAMEEGVFDDLPHQGARLPLVDDSAAGDWALAYRMLRNAGAAPPWIESDKAVRALLDERDRLLEQAARRGAHGQARAQAELTRIVDAANRAIARLNAEAPTSRQHRRLLDLGAELDRLDRAAAGDLLGRG
jgi:DnaJ homolog subfamily C member 28